MSAKSSQMLVDAVNARLREEWGINIGSISIGRLLDEIRYVEQSGDDIDCCIKIPSRSEFMMSLDEAKAVYAALRGER